MISYLVPPSRVRRLQRDPADRARASSSWTGPALGARVRLADLLRVDEMLAVRGSLARPVSGLAIDSRRVTQGDVFFALPGRRWRVRCSPWRAAGHDQLPGSPVPGPSAPA